MDILDGQRLYRKLGKDLHDAAAGANKSWSINDIVAPLDRV